MSTPEAQTCEDLGYDFVLRLAQDRNVDLAAEEGTASLDQAHLKTLARGLSAQETHVVTIAAQRGRPKREASLQITFQAVRIHPPLHGACLRETESTAWVVRVWEANLPDGQEPLEWILLTTLPIRSARDAWEVAQWYEWRWQMEDFHKALKTGCQMERHHLQTIEAIWRMLAILTPLALRLLAIRQAAQQADEVPASDVVSEEVLQVVTHLDYRHRRILTAKELWRAIARLGGYLDRKHDGPPGWQTVWRGWMRILDVLDGVHLAALLHPS